MKSLRWTAVVLATVGLMWLAARGQAASTTTLKLSTLAPENSNLVNAMRAAGQQIEQRTSGRVTVKVYPGAVMGNDQVVLRKIRQGQLHGGTFTAGGISGEFRDYQVLSLPMLFQNYKQVDAARAAVEAKLIKGLEQKGYISFGIMEAGFVYMMSNVPIDSLETLRGRKVWIPEGDPIGARAFKELGVPPTPLPLPDVMTGLQTGLLDTVSSSPVGTIVLQWYTKVKYLIESPLLYSYGTIAIAKPAWDKLAPADQAVAREAFVGISNQLDKQNRIDNDRAMVALKQQGLKFIGISPENQAQMRAIAAKTIDSLVSEGQFTSALVAEVRSIAAANK